jgi:hypothetical protein
MPNCPADDSIGRHPGGFDVGWIPAGDGYELTLDERGKLACRSTGTNGKPLKSVPKAVRETEAAAGLRQLQEWLVRHRATCLREVEDWLGRSLPVPASVIAAVWPDGDWQSILRDVVVVPVGKDGGWRLDEAGFLRDAGPSGRLGVVNLDGESVFLTAERVVLPHPVLLDDLDDLREFAADLGVQQGVLQLFREIWRKPDDPAEAGTETNRYSGGHFEQLRHLTGRATSHGYAVRGGYATRRLWEHGRVVDACVWVGSDDPGAEAETGGLQFLDAEGAGLPLAQVGPVAWSEGMRMAAALYAGRVVREEAAA